MQHFHTVTIAKDFLENEDRASITGFYGGAPKERRRRRAEKRLSKRVSLESLLLLWPPRDMQETAGILFREYCFGEENSLSLTELRGKLGELCEKKKLGEFTLAHKS